MTQTIGIRPRVHVRALVMGVLLVSPVVSQTPSIAAPPRILSVQDSVLARVVDGDGAVELQLTAKHIVFGFTRQGARTIERQVAQSVIQDDRRDPWLDQTVARSVARGVRRIRMVFDVADVANVEYQEGALVLYFRKAGVRRARTGDRLVLERVAEDASRAFIAKYQELKSQRQ